MNLFGTCTTFKTIFKQRDLFSLEDLLPSPVWDRLKLVGIYVIQTFSFSIGPVSMEDLILSVKPLVGFNGIT